MADERTPGAVETEPLTAPPDERDRPAPRGCRVEVSDGVPEDRGKSALLERGTLILGSAPGSGLRLLDPKVSRRHVELAAVQQGIEVTDLDSKNGTYCLGQRLKKAVLAPGSLLEIGQTTLSLTPLDSQLDIQPSSASSYGALLGRSLAMRRLYGLLERLEASALPVLIQGETGTGKEVVARSLHDKSRRQGEPFVVLDCGAVPATLLEAELFGHAKGAFTGASAERPGVIEQASGGTLFLDEIGELPIDMQPKLLRALESKRVRRLGDTSERPVDVRILAATNRNLLEEIQKKRFREDLYYRLAVVVLQLPALRARVDDIPLLAAHFAAEIDKLPPAGLPQELLSALAGYAWPGNVRELRNVVHRTLTLGMAKPELASHAAAPDGIDTAVPYKVAREKVLDRFEATYVRALYDEHGGNISATARAAGVARGYLRTLLRKHGLYTGSGDADD